MVSEGEWWMGGCGKYGSCSFKDNTTSGEVGVHSAVTVRGKGGDNASEDIDGVGAASAR